MCAIIEKLRIWFINLRVVPLIIGNPALAKDFGHECSGDIAVVRVRDAEFERAFNHK